ncbi:hypothetical protein [Nocardioides sp. GXZ039]|uniref:hypothetical protein n=1 Tax=Nocardioides sp. GXZ039 TaxID=3136018 RepID=UPI0030F385ED
MTHQTPLNDDQMSRLMDRAMQPVTAEDTLVAGGMSRGRRAVRRRRFAQGGAVAAVAVAAVGAATLVPGWGDDAGSGVPVAGTPTASDRASTVPSPTSAPDELPPHLQRAQKLLQDKLEVPPSQQGLQSLGFTSVEYDPDGNGVGELLVGISSDPEWVSEHATDLCRRVAASPKPDECVETDTGWLITGPTLPDVLGKDPNLVGVEARYFDRDGRSVDLVAYNAPEAAMGGVPTRPAPVLSADELALLATETNWWE